MNDIHAAAQAGYAAEAERYAKGRPEYPPALLPWLRDELGLTAGRTVVDLGAGTGKFTSLLMQTDAALTAVEPVASMREKLAARFPTLSISEGRAEDLPLASVSMDAIACAQAFHWFANRDALTEMHRVLRPGGRLGLVWNARDESVDWMAAITDIISPYEGDAPRYYKGEWRQPFEGFAGFGPLNVYRFDNEHTGPPEEVILNRFLSVSFIAALEAPRKALVASQLKDLIHQHPALRGQKFVAVRYRTEAFCCVRK